MPTTSTECCVIKAPCLVCLDLLHCDGTQYLNIVSPSLELLSAHDVHYLMLNCFMNCKKLRVLILRYDKVVDNLIHDERSTLEKLLFSLAPTIEELNLDSFFLEPCGADTVPKMRSRALNCLWHLSFYVDFDKFSPTSGALQLIKSLPKLSERDITVHSTSDNAEAVSKYLNTPACLDRSLNKLKRVVIRWFKGSKTELFFIKLLLARTPSLVRIIIKPLRDFCSCEESNITTKLTSFPRASPEAEIFILMHVLTYQSQVPANN
nr:uncharacterized protein LOC108944382 isoform X1 [Nicotiana tomentosiformis]